MWDEIWNDHRQACYSLICAASCLVICVVVAILTAAKAPIGVRLTFLVIAIVVVLGSGVFLFFYARTRNKALNPNAQSKLK